jgi:hypothetical protein
MKIFVTYRPENSLIFDCLIYNYNHVITEKQYKVALSVEDYSRLIGQAV